MGSSSNRYAPRLPQQETKPSTKQLAPTDPILGPEHLLKTGFAQKGLPSGPQEGRKKTSPHSSKREQITTRCPGTKAQETKMVEMRITKPWERRRRGGSLRHTPCSIFKVVSFICSESVRPAVPDWKETGLSLSSPAAWSRSSLHFA